MNDSRSSKLNYWKVVPLSLIICLLINLLSFGLRRLIYTKGEIGELVVTLTVSIFTPIVIGSILVGKQRKNLGWSLIIGAILTLLFWSAAFYSLSSHGW
jgi:hypothetical protein